MRKDGKIAVMVKRKMESDRSLHLTEGGPVKKGSAEVDHGGVERRVELTFWEYL